MPAGLSKNKISRGPFTEAPVWRPFGDGWRPLWPGFRDHGFSIEWHDLPAGTDYGDSFHPHSVEICLNLDGTAEFSLAGLTRTLAPGEAMFYVAGSEPIAARRLSGMRHRFLTVEISRDFLRRRVDGGGLQPHVQSLLAGERERCASHVAAPRKLTASQQQRLPALRQPPSSAGRGLWFEGKVLEMVAEFLFVPHEEMFCERQRRVTQERVQRVIELLRGNLAEPPDLFQLGRRVSCSPFYLSRTFSQALGMTIPRYLRRLRMERAAELLRSGKYNVTEAAMEVGYSSLSHFSQAFCREMGCCPNLYPLLKR